MDAQGELEQLNPDGEGGSWKFREEVKTGLAGDAELSGPRGKPRMSLSITLLPKFPPCLIFGHLSRCQRL